MRVVEVKNLVKRYGKKEALKGISLSVERGDLGVLVGSDGSGRSTLLKIVAGVLEFNEGEVRVLGRDFRSYGEVERVRGRIAFMPEGLGHNLYHSLSVEENLDFFVQLHGLRRETARERKELLLKITGLEEFKDREAGKLSGGMMQKLGIACSLVHLPDLIILDEPTTGIDPLSRREIWRLLLMVSQKEGKTVLVSTSYLDEAERGTFFSLLHEGRLLRTMSPEELGNKSVEEVFREYVGEREEEISIPFGVRGEAPDPAIVVEGVSKDFGGFRALDGVSLEVRRGEVLGLLGPNGAGKTTLIKILVGLYEPSEGSVLVAGKRNPREIRRNIGYMSQKFSLYSDLTVVENLLLWGSAYGVPRGELKERIGLGLRMLRLEGFKSTLVKNLPLGMKQRLGLLSSFLHGPPILFLDEPTSGVDPVEREFFWTLIGHLSKELGVTALVSTHHMDEAEFCDRVCLLSRGRVIALDTPRNLKEELMRREGRAYEVRPKDLYLALEILEDRGITAVPYGRRFKFFTKEDPMDVLRGIEYGELKESRVSMEDVFVSELTRYEALQG